MTELSGTNERFRIRWAKSSRRHLVGRGHARFVMQTAVPLVVPATEEHDDRYSWIGYDDRGVELEVGAVRFPDCLMVTHVMATALRRR